jgi:hypothetical protein
LVKLSSKKLGGFSLEKGLTLPLVTASLLLGHENRLHPYSGAIVMAVPGFKL